jgi:two-component sensor histidine kinase
MIAHADATYVRHLKDRIHSLAVLQGALIKHDWKAVPLNELVKSQLSYVGAGSDDRFTVAGPLVQLKPAAAQSLAMALHELATNAAKYGALGAQNGRVEIQWQISSQSEPRLTLSWVERGGPPATRPSRLGFGSRVTTKMVELSTNGAVVID